MKKNTQFYILRFAGVAVLYAGMLTFTLNILRNLGGSPWRFAATLLPIFPIGIGVAVFLRMFKEMDELQKHIQLNALAFSFCATGLLTFSFGLLQNTGLPQISFIAVFPVMLTLWGLGYIFADWRYQ